MSSQFISHRKPPRKRAHAQAWTPMHVGILVVTALAIMAASWLAPELNRPAVTPPRPAPTQTARPASPPAPALTAVDAAADPVGAPRPRPARAAPRRTGVPLDAAAELRTDDYEILSAAELEGISQARD